MLIKKIPKLLYINRICWDFCFEDNLYNLMIIPSNLSFIEIKEKVIKINVNETELYDFEKTHLFIPEDNLSEKWKKVLNYYFRDLGDFYSRLTLSFENKLIKDLDLIMNTKYLDFKTF